MTAAAALVATVALIAGVTVAVQIRDWRRRPGPTSVAVHKTTPGGRPCRVTVAASRPLEEWVMRVECVADPLFTQESAVNCHQVGWREFQADPTGYWAGVERRLLEAFDADHERIGR